MTCGGIEGEGVRVASAVAGAEWQGGELGGAEVEEAVVRERRRKGTGGDERREREAEQRDERARRKGGCLAGFRPWRAGDLGQAWAAPRA